MPRADADVFRADLNHLVRCAAQHGPRHDRPLALLAVERLDFRRHHCLSGLTLPDGRAVGLIFVCVLPGHGVKRNGFGVGDRAARLHIQTIGKRLENGFRLARQTALRYHVVHADLLHKVRAAVRLRCIEPFYAVKQCLRFGGVPADTGSSAVHRYDRERIEFAALRGQAASQLVFAQKLAGRRTQRLHAERIGEGIRLAGGG